uniref:autotransporter outer membrane beta-barrel domain-containing protein n=1 Tax=Yersinia frederiksenii TaxID=29484 RepID=UPI002112A6DA|nr:autotransporter outer membrane beta-barrel domain-containing protein [Yersinia frederiksenii]
MLTCSLSGITPALAEFTEDVGTGYNETVVSDQTVEWGTQNIREGGIANHTVINSMGVQDVKDKGTANDTVINFNGTQNVVGGTTHDTVIKQGGRQNVYENGVTHDTVINTGGGQNVYGGTTHDTVIKGGGQNVYGGTAHNTEINSGWMDVHENGIANDTEINGGVMDVYDGGIANRTEINGGYQMVNNGGTAHGTTVNNIGRLTVTGNGQLTGKTTINDTGTIDFEKRGSSTGALQNTGELIFQRRADYTLDFNLGGSGGLTLDSPQTLTLSTASSYTGATNVKQGTLQAGADNVFSTNSDYTTEKAGTLDLNGHNQTLQSLTHAGGVNFGGTGGTTLTLTGNYTGDNGLLKMNTELKDDSSVTDKLVIEGDTAGNTFVQVNNLGGSGAQTLNGIELITVGGMSEGEFTQQERIIAGAYEYYLQRGRDSLAANWYLSNTIDPDPVDPVDPTPGQPVERPEAAGYSANLAAANNLFVTRLHDRLGETQYIDALTGEQKVTSLWLRNEGGHNRFRDTQGQLRTQSNRYVMQLGGDIAQWSHTGTDRFHLGLMVGYGNSKSKTESRVSGYNARASVDGYSTGVYGTWYANSADKTGLYVDSWAQYSWFNNTVNGQDLASEEYKSKGMTASVESGYTFKVGENAAKNATYFIQPKAQVTWMGVKADDHKEANGTRVSGNGQDNIQTRLGVKAFMNGYSAQDKGKDRSFQPFVEANWVHNTQDFGTTMDGMTVKQAGAANIGELKLGVEGQLNKSVNLWGNVGQQVGNQGYSDTAVMLGVKYTF